MKIKWVVLGKSSPSCVEILTRTYIQRLERLIKFQYLEVIPPKKITRLPVELRKQKEGELLLKHIGGGDYVVLLDERGREFTSGEWARHLEQTALHIAGEMVFVTGGPYGFSESLYNISREKLSLSRMTFSHQIIRVMFAEQLYRAVSIIKNLPYHNE